MEATREHRAKGYYKPSVNVVLIPRCPKCSAANPKGLDHCPQCNAEAPVQRRQLVNTAASRLNKIFPWHGRVLLAIGAALTRLARYLEGVKK